MACLGDARHQEENGKKIGTPPNGATGNPSRPRPQPNSLPPRGGGFGRESFDKLRTVSPSTLLRTPSPSTSLRTPSLSRGLSRGLSNRSAERVGVGGDARQRPRIAPPTCILPLQGGGEEGITRWQCRLARRDSGLSLQRLHNHRRHRRSRRVARHTQAYRFCRPPSVRHVLATWSRDLFAAVYS